MLHSPLGAQNLLIHNAGFEANTAYYTPGWGFPQGSPDVLPGWTITLDPGGDGYAGASANQSPQDLEGTRYGYIYSGWGSAGILETAPDSRAPVEKDKVYTLWFMARCDVSWGEALATVSLVWHPNRNNHTTVGEATNLDLTLPPCFSPDEPMQTFQITAIAPPGANYASVRVTRPPNNYVPMIVDDFVIMAEPAEVSLSIQQDGPKSKLSWNRSRKYRLESSPDFSSGNWDILDKPIKGKGPKHHIDLPLDEPARFFRLKKAD